MNWIWRNILSALNGVTRMKDQATNRTIASANTKPVAGDSTMAAMVLPRPDHTTEFQPALQTPAPTSPPIRACEEDEGIPASQVTTFQTMAPISAPKITW